MRFLAAVALAVSLLQSCQGDRERTGGTLNIVFSQAGDPDTERRYFLGCEPPIGPRCEEASVKEAVLLPGPSGPVCPLPTTAWVVKVRGTWDGRKIDVTYLPCDKVSDRAIEEWARLWDLERPK